MINNLLFIQYIIYYGLLVGLIAFAVWNAAQEDNILSFLHRFIQKFNWRIQKLTLGCPKCMTTWVSIIATYIFYPYDLEFNSDLLLFHLCGWLSASAFAATIANINSIKIIQIENE